MAVKSILDDSDLWLGMGFQKATAAQDALPPEQTRVRFRPASAYALDYGLAPGTEGTVTARFDQDGAERLNLLLDGLFAMGVPADEVEGVAS